MQTKRYQVECLDRDTGEKSLHVFEGVNEKAASDLANRMGFLVGGVTILESEPAQAAQPVMLPTSTRPPRRWVWFIFGTVFGAAMFFLVLTIIALTSMSARNVDIMADRRWLDEWPTLSFPDRPRSGVPFGVEVNYDEFRNYTGFSTDIELGDIRLSLDTTETGRVDFPKGPPRTVLLSVSGRRGGEGRELILLVDGTRISLTGTISGVFDLPTRDLLRMVNAKDVRGQCGTVEFTMSPDGFARLRGFASMLKR